MSGGVDVSVLKLGWDVLVGLIGGGAAAAGWMIASWRRLGGRVDRHEGRLGELEQRVAALPAMDDMHAFDRKLLQMEGDIREMRAEQRGGFDMIRNMQEGVAEIRGVLSRRTR